MSRTRSPQMHISKICFMIPLLVLLAFAGCFFYLYSTSDARLFRQLCGDFFAASLSGDSLSLHYTLADPSAYLEKTSPASLPVYTRDGQDESAALMENFLASLQQIDPEKLDEQDRFTHSLLLSWLETELDGSLCLYFEEPLSPTSGMHTELPVLLAEYAFRSMEDVTDYLDLLESVPACLEGLASYEKEKAAAGLFMTEEDTAAVVDQCDALFEKERLEAGDHFLQTTFSERLDGLISSGLLDPAQKDSLVSQNNRLLKTVVAPAYVSLADQIFLLSENGLFQESICQQKGGTSYYLYLLKHNTGTSRTPEEIRELLAENLQELYNELQSLLLEYQRLTGTLPEGELAMSDFPLQDAEAILADLQSRMAEDFPALPDAAEVSRSLTASGGTFSPSTASISCTVKSVDASLEPHTSPAFYLTPPMDAVTENVIYINNASTLPGLELYTTLAHEGYPGHLYQTVYSQLYQNSQTDNPIRGILNFSGYVEGWAYYVENLAYGYACDVLQEAGASAAEQFLPRIACTERNLQVCLYSLMDLAIHYTGASREEIFESLASLGITDLQTASEIYSYIRREPTTYLKYYLGYLEVLTLQEQARELWQDSYSALRFHTFLLEAGPADFENLRLLLESAS